MVSQKKNCHTQKNGIMSLQYLYKATNNLEFYMWQRYLPSIITVKNIFSNKKNLRDCHQMKLEECSKSHFCGRYKQRYSEKSKSGKYVNKSK